MKPLLSLEELELLLGPPSTGYPSSQPQPSAPIRPALEDPLLREEQLSELRRIGTGKILARLLGKTS